jgi:epoxyqueuosine reductase
MLQAPIKQRALEIGFDLVGIAPIAAWEDLKFSRQWVERGYGGEMRYLQNPKRDDPRLVLPSAKSVICVGLIYNVDLPYSIEVRSEKREARRQETGVRSQEADLAKPARNSESKTSHLPLATSHFSDARDHAWISRYAWGADYHATLRSKLEGLRAAVEELAPGVETRVFVDTGPIVERAFARLSGIGWMGKNTCLINESKGSWFFLGVILTSLDLSPDLPAPDRCGSCTRCLEACPTGALVEPYVMDASRCISYFTIELKGSIPEEFRSAIGANVFGCDICQDVCPWNERPSSVVRGPLRESHQPSAISSQRRVAATTETPEFRPMRVNLDYGVAPAEAQTPNPEPRSFSLFSPPLEALASLSEEDFPKTFRHSPVKRIKYRGWLRNLCVAMGNSGDAELLPHLRRLREHADPIVREHAEWAIEKLLKARLEFDSAQPVSQR